MIGVWGVVNELTKEIREIKSQNLSCSASVDNLEDTSSNLRIGSTVKLSEPGSQTVEVMSVTMDQPMDQNTDPGPSSSPNDTIELGCSNDDLLAADSDDETQATQDDHHLLSESEEEDKVSPEEPLSTRWADDE
jgi:tRNA-binding EMAP/Myf-like protein